MKAGVLPNLIIIGAMKCATTSLHYYLGLHPQISMSKSKELDFFVLERNWPKGKAWYESNFKAEAKVRGESSPNYAICQVFRGVPERMHALIPDAKLIYMVRDPLERMISHYLHEYTRGAEHRPAAEALGDAANNRYLYRSLYYQQLRRYLGYFPKANIMVLTQEDLYEARRDTLRKVFNFLDVDPNFDCPKFSSLKHTSAYKRRKNRVGLLLERRLGNADRGALGRLPTRVRGYAEKLIYLPFSYGIKRPALPACVRQKLIDRFAADVDCLRAHTGRDFESWCV